MSYKEALEAAGAKVLAIEYFGSYQGDWYAKVKYKRKTGYVTGCFGSCSGCDAFEGEFGYGEEECDKHRWGEEDAIKGCKVCASMKALYQTRLAEFGKGYLDGLLTQKEAEAKAAKDIEWDYDAKEMLEWIKRQGSNV